MTGLTPIAIFELFQDTKRLYDAFERKETYVRRLMLEAMSRALPAGAVIDLARGKQRPGYLADVTVIGGNARGTTRFKVKEVASIEFNFLSPELSTFELNAVPLSAKTGQAISASAGNAKFGKRDTVRLKGRIAVEAGPDDDTGGLIALLDFLTRHMPTPAEWDKTHFAGIPRDVFTEEQQASIERDAAINPKVAPLVEALNRAGIRTTMSGDFYGLDMVYVDLDDISQINTTGLPPDWLLTGKMARATIFHTLGRQPEDTDEAVGLYQMQPPYDRTQDFTKLEPGWGYRISRAGGAVTKEEAEALVAKITPRPAKSGKKAPRVKKT